MTIRYVGGSGPSTRPPSTLELAGEWARGKTQRAIVVAYWLLLVLLTSLVFAGVGIDGWLIAHPAPPPKTDIYSPAEHFMRAMAHGDAAEARKWATQSCVDGNSNLCLAPGLDAKWKAQAARFLWGGLGTPHWIRPRLMVYDLYLYDVQTYAVQELIVIIQERDTDSLVLNEWDNLVPPGGSIT